MNILLLGKPGAGKGTLTQKILSEGYIQLSTGDLLRKEISIGSPLGFELELLLKEGNFASDGVVLDLVEKFLSENSGKSVVFDGFPRTLNQAQECLKRGILFDKVIEIDCSDEEVTARIINRRIHLQSGRIYNVLFNPPLKEGLDDITGDKLHHRSDDKKEVVLSRLQKYQELTYPIVSYIKSRGLMVHKIDGTKPHETQLEEFLAIIGSQQRHFKIK